jgi:hypothetical protein
MSMSVGQRDAKMSEMPSIAAEAFCKKHESPTHDNIKANPEDYLKHTVPYITVRTLHRHEKLSPATRKLSPVWKLIHDGSNA